MSKILISRLALLLLLFTPLLISAQEVIVLDAEIGIALSDVYIYNDSEKKHVSTDREGRADISALFPCDTIYFSHTAFEQVIISPVALKELGYTVKMNMNAYIMPAFRLVTAREHLIDSPSQLERLSVEQIKAFEPRTTTDLLEGTGQIFVQRSQLGGGSPVLRGFEANRILLMIDGVRLNNAIYRSGHLQNAITVDPFILEGTDIIFGPSSLIYGSDALGGVIHFKSKSPLPIISKAPHRSALSAAQRYGSAGQEQATHIDLSYAGGKASWLGSFTRSSIGQLRTGRNRQHGNSEWGLIPDYVIRVGDRDSVVVNDRPHVVPTSGYQQYDFAQKLNLQLSDSLLLRFNLQYSTTIDVPRSDQLAARRNGELRFGEWSYGPQERLLASLSLDLTSHSNVFDKGTVIFAYQQVGEDRLTRNLYSTERFVRKEDVGVTSLNIDMVKRLKRRRDLYYGMEITNNEVISVAYIEDLNTGIREHGPTRYPDGGSTMTTLAAYAALNAALRDNFTVNFGMRYSQSYLYSKFNDMTFYELPFREVNFDNGALTGSLSLDYMPDETWDIGLTAATGFRSPNVDDYGKVFERAGIVVVPTAGLKPEYTLSSEARITKTWAEERVSLTFGAFYTFIQDAIVQRESTLAGQDSILYEGQLAQVAINQNEDEAYIKGYNIAFKWQPDNHWTFTATATQTLGRVLDRDEPLSHIPPFFAKADLGYEQEKWSLGVYALYNDTKLSRETGPGRTDNADQGINGAFPSWQTYHFRSAVQVDERIVVRFIVNNITDVHYKGFASGIAAPGRNLSLTVRYAI